MPFSYWEILKIIQQYFHDLAEWNCVLKTHVPYCSPIHTLNVRALFSSP